VLKKRKFTKVGQVWAKKDDPEAFFVKLGQKGKNADYDLTVEITVKNAAGEIVAQQTDGFLNLSDPRKSPFADEASLSKVPGLRFDILLPQEQN